MCFRSGGNKIRLDSFSRWSQPPASLLQRYLALAIRGTVNGNSDTVEISGEIMRFDGDLDSKTAHICLLATVSKVNDDGSDLILRDIFSATMPFDGKSTSSFTKAMGAAAEKIAADLAARIKTANANR